MILFSSVLLGAYAGYLVGWAVWMWGIVGILAALLGIFVSARKIRALLILVAAFSISAALANYQFDNFKMREARIPGGYASIEGIVEEVIPTLLSGNKIQFRADAGFRLRVSLQEAAAMVPIQAGDRIRLMGQVKHLQHAMMPGDFDSYWLGVARGYEGRLSVHNPFRVIVTPAKAGGQKFFWADIRRKLRERFTGALTPREAGILLALMIGETDFFEESQKEIYTGVGAGHLLAVSGLQVSCLSFLFFYFFRALLLLMPGIGRLSRARLPAVILTLLSIWSFTALSGASASAVRAAFMSSVVLVGMLFRRDASMLEAFGIAGFVTVLLAPQSVLDPSFLFSYLAIFGLLISGALLAGIVTLPLSAYYFGTVAVGGLLANLILVPISVFLQTPAIFLGVIGVFKPAAYFAGALEALCEALGDYLGGLWWLSPPSAWQTAGLIIACVLFSKKQRVGATVLLGLLLLPGFLEQQNGVNITVLPAGQGDSSVFEFPDRQIMVIDGGPREEYLLNYLRRYGIRKIDFLVLSHPDADHITGFFRVLEEVEVKEIWHSGFDEQHFLMKRLLDQARVRGIRVLASRELIGEHIFGGARVTVLYPHPFDVSQSTNNNSLVVKVSYGGDSALWPGDLESEREQLANSYWRSTVLKAPHHGSKSSSSEHLVRQVVPKHVIFCTQAENQFGFPNSQIKSRWELAGAKTWDTGAQGMIRVALTGSGVKISSFL